MFSLWIEHFNPVEVRKVLRLRIFKQVKLWKTLTVQHLIFKKMPNLTLKFLDMKLKMCVRDLLGQFSREPEVSVYDVHQGADPLKKEATMEVKGNKLLVTRYVSAMKSH